MTRAEWDLFQNDAGKRIVGGIRFSPKPQHASLLWSGRLVVMNSFGVEVFLEISYNEELDSKVFCLFCPDAGGAICRLCVDGTRHDPYGRSHKHRLRSPECPKRNLKDEIEERADLSGKDVAELFGVFCQLTKMTHEGLFTPPGG